MNTPTLVFCLLPLLPALQETDPPPKSLTPIPIQQTVGPTDIIVILDSTTSMGGMAENSGRYVLARWILSDIMDFVPEGVNFGVLELRDAVSEFRKLEPVVASDLPKLRRTMWDLRPAGRGELRDAIQRAGSILRRREGTTKPIVVVITDGEDCNCGEAHGAAAELREAVGGDLEFLVVAPCQWGPVAQQLQSLAESAQGTFTLAHSRNALQPATDLLRLRCSVKRNAPVAQLEKELKAAEHERKLAIENRETRLAENQRLRNTIADLDRDLVAEKKAVNGLQVSLQEAEEALKSARLFIEDQRETLAEQVTQIQQQGAENSRVGELLETTQASARQTQRMLDASLTETKQLNATIHKLNQENQGVAESLAEKESANEKLRQANESLKIEVAELSTKRNDTDEWTQFFINIGVPTGLASVLGFTGSSFLVAGKKCSPSKSKMHLVSTFSLRS